MLDSQLAAKVRDYASRRGSCRALTLHLDRLQSEAIEIIREAVAQFRNPVMLFSAGKDSTVMLHLARKAFFPAPLPFPLLHIATTWDFRETIHYRDLMVEALGLQLVTHTNDDGLARGIDPFAAGPTLHAQVMATEALKQALELHGFDAAFGGGRRDEEKSRAKERIFSIRATNHVWDPRHQRAELWNLYNGRLEAGQTARVFPLSNWTEFDVWDYISAEGIPVVPLYLAARRPVVRRSGLIILVDDDRLPLAAGEEPEWLSVRFRTLGCYPLTAGMVSEAASVEAVISELRATRQSERHGRIIDHDANASMERKKREGYF